MKSQVLPQNQNTAKYQHGAVQNVTNMFKTVCKTEGLETFQLLEYQWTDFVLLG